MSRPLLRVASYNIRKAIGTDRRRRPDRILSVLQEMDADVIALQEADRRFGPRVAAIPHELIDLHGRYKFVPLGHHVDGLGWHGNAFLVRRDIDIIDHEPLHLPCLEPRGAITTQLEIAGHRLRLFGMHLDLSGLWRRRQANKIIQAAQAVPDVPTILMGDLNEWSANRGCLADFQRHFDFAPCGASFHARRPVARLDRIMHSDRVELMDSGVHDTPLARQSSDHLPIWADIRLK